MFYSRGGYLVRVYIVGFPRRSFIILPRDYRVPRFGGFISTSVSCSLPTLKVCGLLLKARRRAYITFVVDIFRFRFLSPTRSRRQRTLFVDVPRSTPRRRKIKIKNIYSTLIKNPVWRTRISNPKITQRVSTGVIRWRTVLPYFFELKSL